MVPDVSIQTVTLYLSASSRDLPAKYGKRIRDAGGKFTDIRGGNARHRYVTLPFSERELIDELMAVYGGGTKGVMKVIAIGSPTIDAHRCYVINSRPGIAIHHWDRQSGLAASAFLERSFASKLEAYDWETDLARWRAEDGAEAARRLQRERADAITDLRERIASEAVRIAGGKNDIEDLKDMARAYSAACAEAEEDGGADPDIHAATE